MRYSYKNVIIGNEIDNLSCKICLFLLQTSVGDILIAVNPFKELQIYDKKVKMVFICHNISIDPMRNKLKNILFDINSLNAVDWAFELSWGPVDKSKAPIKISL